jgi:prevent-host-death family protein
MFEGTVGMETVSSGDFQRKIGHYQDRALVEPIVVTRNGRERLVLLSAEEFKRLKRRDREVLRLADFTQADVDAIRNAEPPAKASHFDHEITD